MRKILLPTILILAILPISSILCGGDPETIDILYISRWLLQPWHRSNLLAADPSISLLGVPMPGHSTIQAYGMDVNVMNRMMRMYMPRTFTQLMDERDVVVLHEAPCGSTKFPQVYFDAKWISWFVKGVQDEGLGLTMWGGDASWGGTSGGQGSYTSWGDTMLDAILPFESLGTFNLDFALPHRRDFIDANHPLARLPWDQARPIELLNKVEPNQGAIRIADAVAGKRRDPWMAWWTSGNGRVVGETAVTGSKDVGHEAINWPWFQDFVIYLTYFTADKKIPEDIYLVHKVREEINQHLGKVSLLVSVLEFVDKFGVSTAGLYDELDALNAHEKEAEKSYRREEYDAAIGILEEVELDWIELNAKAIETKERALLWVYIIEWLVVSGVTLISGVFIWMVMVKRRLYKEIRTTRTTT